MNIEVQGEMNRMYATVHSKKGSHSPDPLRVPRPWTIEEPKKVSGIEEQRAFFAGNIKVEKKEVE